MVDDVADGAQQSRPSKPSTTGDDLAERIDAARASGRRRPTMNIVEKYDSVTLAWRMTLELVVGTGIGFCIGWGIDSLFGSAPLFMIIFGLLGFVAGIKTVVGTAKEASRRRMDADRGETNGDGSGPA